MMNHNYHYIIAGLPDLAPDMNGNAPTYESLAATIKEQLSERVLRLVDWLEYGFDEAHLTDHFYHSVARQKNPFLAAWYAFDLRLRNAKVVYLEKKAGKKGTSAVVGDWDPEFEEYTRLQQIFEIPNLIEREIALDKLRWAKISDLTLYEYFTINTILAFLTKCRIADRWNKLDKATGAKLFETLVQEVRGTFKGIEF
jgi:hypothetical protein